MARKLTITFKDLRVYGDIWGELFRIPDNFSTGASQLTAFGFKDKIKRSDRYHTFSFYADGFGNVVRKKTRYGDSFLEKQHMKMFYGNLSDKHLRYLWKISANHLGYTKGVFLHFMESLIHVVVYRSNFTFNVFEAKKLVELGFFEINGIQINKVCRLKFGDVLRPYYYNTFYDFFSVLFELDFHWFPPPAHLLFDYDLLATFYLGFDNKDIIEKIYYPAGINLDKIDYVYFK